MMEEKICPFCGSKMKLRRRSLNRSVLPSGLEYYAVDTLMKCPNCYYVSVFGIPITERRYYELWERWGGRVDEQGLEAELIKNRLKSLGYTIKEKKI